MKIVVPYIILMLFCKGLLSQHLSIDSLMIDKEGIAVEISNFSDVDVVLLGFSYDTIWLDSILCYRPFSYSIDGSVLNIELSDPAALPYLLVNCSSISLFVDDNKKGRVPVNRSNYFLLKKGGKVIVFCYLDEDWQKKVELVELTYDLGLPSTLFANMKN